MQIHGKLVAIAVILVASTESKPSGSNLFVTNYEASKEPIETISLQPQVLHYSSFSPYYFYNIHSDIDTIPAAIVEKTTISHYPSYSLYYGTPVFNLRVPTPLVPHEKKPPQPEEKDATTTMKTNGATDTVEKLDARTESQKEKKKPCLISDNAENDSITIESV
ncbi:uncharacterized protein LOC143186009 [Calliopsis andreniformis]|uniref:uncharacterized protein LOC143186009 n=1 Tax=Calliopsis andreniformis TaxID=337506 RepID=UPI003FCCE733